MKKLIFIIMIFSILLSFLFYESINNYQDEYFIKIWNERFSEKLSPRELKNKYPAITYYKLTNPPYTEWCFISSGKAIPFIPSPHHDNIIYKDEHGIVLAFQKGNRHDTPIWAYTPLEKAEFIHRQDPSVSVYDVIVETMTGNDRNFKVYTPSSKEKVDR